MSLASLSARRPIGTCMIFFAVMVVGLVALRELAVDLLPSADAPWVSITTRYEGVAPQEIETLITRPIEQVVSTVQGVERIESSSSESLSRVSLRFQWGANLETAVNDVRAMLDRVRGRLPEDADAPMVYKFDISERPVAMLGLSGSGDERRLRYVADEVLARRLESVTGVASVDVRGGRVREIQIQLDSQRLAALAIPATEVSAALARENRDVSAGDMKESGREVVIRATGEFRSVKEIEETVVARRGDRSIRVADLGTVVDGWQELTSELWIDGTPGIRMSVSKQSGSNTVDVVKALRREIDELNAEYEGRLKLVVLWDSSDYIEAAVTNVQSSALMGALLAVFILLGFLRNVRATFIIGIAIPIAILATFALMFASGISLNIISLGGLALGVGMLVDNSIVILENVYVKLQRGRSRMQAAIEGTEEMALAITAGTLTTIAVFAPVVFLEGFTAIFFGEMALVVSFSLACSLVVALTLVPALAVMILEPEQRPAGFAGRLYDKAGAAVDGMTRSYGSRVRKAMRRPLRVIGVSAFMLAGSVVLFPLVGTELLPETDEGRIDLRVELPVGTPLEKTMVVMQELEAKIRGSLQEGELDSITTVAGPEAAWRPAGSNEGSMQIALVPVGERQRGVNEILAGIRAATSKTPGALVRGFASSTNPLMRFMRGGDERLTVEVRGHDIAESNALADRVIELAKGVPGVTDAYVDREQGKMEVSVVPDRQRLADLGLTGQHLADAVEHYVLGRVATYYRDGGEEHAIRVQLAPGDRERVESLGNLPLLTASGNVVPVSAVARLERGTGPSAITRIDQERVQRVNVAIGKRALGEVAADLRAGFEQLDVPNGFRLQLAGEFEEQGEAFSSLLTGILLAIFLVYAVLVVQLESLLQPTVIMTAVPFAAVGVVLTLLLTGTTFNMNSFLGSVVLVGICVNNSIVLVDTIGHLRRNEGMSVREAVIEAGVRRLRPVLMTTATTVLGMLPLAFGMGEGSEIQVPLARVIVGGLVSSTVITLLFVPALYMVLEGRKEAAATTSVSGEPAV